MKARGSYVSGPMAGGKAAANSSQGCAKALVLPMQAPLVHEPGFQECCRCVGHMCGLSLQSEPGGTPLHSVLLHAPLYLSRMCVTGICSMWRRPAEGAPGKRKLLPAPKPVAALPQSVLFGNNFQIPRLSRQ